MVIIENRFNQRPLLALLVACMAFLALTVSAADQRDGISDWSALVPQGWEAPLILPAPEADGHYPVDPSSLVQNLDEQHVSLAGYMIPVRFEQNVVAEFLFVPYLGHHTNSHAHYDANQMIYVKLLDPVTVENPFSAWIVDGLLRVASVTTEDGRTGYTLEHADAEPYNPHEREPDARRIPTTEGATYDPYP
jgi:hypothetical protein